MANLIIFVFNILFFSITVAELPSFIPVCGRLNPKLDECVANSINALRSKLVTGIPELNVPSIEPLLLEKTLTLTNLNQIKVLLNNVKIYNSREFQIRNMHMDIQNQKIDISLYFNQLRLVGDYDIAARIIVDIQGKGSIQIDGEDVDLRASGNYTLRKTKKGMKLHFSSLTTKIKMKDYQSHLMPLNQGADRKVLDDSIDMVLKTNRREIINSITPSFEKAISSAILNIGNKIVANSTYDELLPNRE